MRDRYNRVRVPTCKTSGGLVSSSGFVFRRVTTRGYIEVARAPAEALPSTHRFTASAEIEIPTCTSICVVEQSENPPQIPSFAQSGYQHSKCTTRKMRTGPHHMWHGTHRVGPPPDQTSGARKTLLSSIPEWTQSGLQLINSSFN